MQTLAKKNKDLHLNFDCDRLDVDNEIPQSNEILSVDDKQEDIDNIIELVRKSPESNSLPYRFSLCATVLTIPANLFIIPLSSNSFNFNYMIFFIGLNIVNAYMLFEIYQGYKKSIKKEQRLTSNLKNSLKGRGLKFLKFINQTPNIQGWAKKFLEIEIHRLGYIETKEGDENHFVKNDLMQVKNEH